jgi:hypothetical protein
LLRRSTISKITRFSSALTIFALSACAGHAVKFIHPQSGATAECSASGFGIGASFSEGFVSGCARAYEERGYVKLDQLSAEERAAIEKRGLVPKN